MVVLGEMANRITKTKKGIVFQIHTPIHNLPNSTNWKKEKRNYSVNVFSIDVVEFHL